MNPNAELLRNSLRKNANLLVTFLIVFGLHIRDFLEPLWITTSVSAAWANWITHGLPEIPATLIMIAIAFAIVVALDVGKESQKGGYGERTDGYRPSLDD